MDGKQKKFLKLIVFLLIIVIVIVLIKIQPQYETIAVATDELEKDLEYNILQNQINLEQIILDNKEETKEILQTETIELEYNTKYENNAELPKGTIQVIQEGVTGEQEVIFRKVYKGEELVTEQQIGAKVTKAAVDKIIQIGTANYTSNYKIQKDDKLYVTAEVLDYKKNPSANSENITVLSKNEQVIYISKQDEWYKVKYENKIGWVKADCVTYISPNTIKIDTNDANYTKQQLLAKLNKQMDLNKISGLSLTQFKKILNDNEKDKNSIFKNNAEYFYYIEKQYKINGVFIASVAIHESNWGTSKIALDKKNLFGYGAYDRNPYENAYTFSSYAEGIDLVARIFCKNYLNPAGTKIYTGEVATGRYYNGSTLDGVNKKYATDSNWANSVYKWMEYLYNRI